MFFPAFNKWRESLKVADLKPNPAVHTLVKIGYICTRLVQRSARTSFGYISYETHKKMHLYCNSLYVRFAWKMLNIWNQSPSTMLYCFYGRSCTALSWFLFHVQQGDLNVVSSHGNFWYVSFNAVMCRHSSGCSHVHTILIASHSMLPNTNKRPALCDLMQCRSWH